MSYVLKVEQERAGEGVDVGEAGDGRYSRQRLQGVQSPRTRTWCVCGNLQTCQVQGGVKSLGWGHGETARFSS